MILAGPPPAYFNKKCIILPLPPKAALKSLQDIIADFTRDPTRLLALAPNLSEASGKICADYSGF